MLAVAHWYTSSGFLAVAAIVATLLAGGIGALITYIVSVPRRQLLYSLQSSTSMLTASPDARKDIKVFYLDKELKDPHVLKVSLNSRSRSDIPSDVFDQGRPIILDVGVPIVALLPGDASTGSVLKVESQDTKLKIGPDLISKRQQMAFNLLTDGGNAHLTCEAHLVNVKVRQQPPEARTDRIILLAAVFATGLALGMITYAVRASDLSAYVSFALVLSLIIVIAVILTAATVTRFRR